MPSALPKTRYGSQRDHKTVASSNLILFQTVKLWGIGRDWGDVILLRTIGHHFSSLSSLENADQLRDPAEFTQWVSIEHRLFAVIDLPYDDT